MFQPALTRHDFDVDSAMGGSILTDDKSRCTFVTDEEVSEFVSINTKDEVQVLCVIYFYILSPFSTSCRMSSDLFVSVWVEYVHCIVIVWQGTSCDHH